MKMSQLNSSKEFNPIVEELPISLDELLVRSYFYLGKSNFQVKMNCPPPSIKNCRIYIPPMMWNAYLDRKSTTIPDWIDWKDKMVEWGFDELGMRYKRDLNRSILYWQSSTPPYTNSHLSTSQTIKIMAPINVEMYRKNCLHVHTTKIDEFDKMIDMLTQNKGVPIILSTDTKPLCRTFSTYGDIDLMAVHDYIFTNDSPLPSKEAMTQHAPFLISSIISDNSLYETPIRLERIMQYDYSE